jgi:TusA-related sulfurtransferase
METFDLHDTIVSFTLLQIANHFQRMKSGDEIEVIGNDPGIQRDIKKILPSSEYRVVAVDKKQDNSRNFRLRLKKKSHHTLKQNKEAHHV